jgi:hydrogenase maturation factor HypF (carbamoyltransferase family)
MSFLRGTDHSDSLLASKVDQSCQDNQPRFPHVSFDAMFFAHMCLHVSSYHHVAHSLSCMSEVEPPARQLGGLISSIGPTWVHISICHAR